MYWAPQPEVAPSSSIRRAAAQRLRNDTSGEARGTLLERCSSHSAAREVGHVLRLETAPFHLSRNLMASGTSISFRGCSLVASDAAVLAIAISNGALHCCRDLDLVGNMIGDGLEALSLALGAGALPRLVSLWLCGTGVTDSGVSHLAMALVRRDSLRTGWMQRPSCLTALHLSRNQISDAGAHTLAASAARGLRACSILRLSHNHIGNDGLNVLAACEWPRLERLYISHNEYSDSSELSSAIEEGVRLPALMQLHVDDTTGTGMVNACSARLVTLSPGRKLSR